MRNDRVLLAGTKINELIIIIICVDVSGRARIIDDGTEIFHNKRQDTKCNDVFHNICTKLIHFTDLSADKSCRI